MLKSQTEKKELFSWKILFIIVLTAWIMIVDTSPAFVVPRIFFDVSPTATDRRVMLYGRNDTIIHPDLESVPPSIEGWNKADISYKWSHLKEAYHAESQILFCYTNSKDPRVYVSIMQTDSERKLVHGLTYCYELQGYSSISKRIVDIEPYKGFPLPINLWFIQSTESSEGWMQAFWYIITYQEGTVDKAYFMQVQVYVPTPQVKEKAERIALEFAQAIAAAMLRSLIPSVEETE